MLIGAWICSCICVRIYVVKERAVPEGIFWGSFFLCLFCYECRYLSVSRYIRKIADINGVALIYLGNRRYNFSCADIFEKSLI
ncbi:hypothetical protein FO501_04255 [Bacillus pacificus]|nr:hypothetical protein [Bacillus pacificus]